MSEGFLRLTRKWPEGAAVAALRDIDAVSHKKHRSACRRINQCFPKTSSVIGSDYNNLCLLYQILKKVAKRHFGHRNDQVFFANPVVEQVLEPDPFIYYES